MAIDALIIEDDHEHSTMIRESLESVGLSASVAPNAAEGLALALRDRPRLVITDIQLPDLDGFELCRRIKSDPALRAIPVLMVTGTYKKDEDRLRGEAMGADAYLLKPFRVIELIGAVRKLLNLPA